MHGAPHACSGTCARTNTYVQGRMFAWPAGGMLLKTTDGSQTADEFAAGLQPKRAAEDDQQPAGIISPPGRSKRVRRGGTGTRDAAAARAPAIK